MTNYKPFIKNYAKAIKACDTSVHALKILRAVLIDCDAKTMQFTDLDVLLTLKNVPIEGTGKHLFDAKKVNELFKAKNINGITIEGKQLIVNSASVATLNALDNGADEWPILQLNGETNAVFIDMKPAIFKNVQHAISPEQSRYYLNGVYLHNYNNVLRTVATDGCRLVMNELENCTQAFDGVIIPRKTISLTCSLFDSFALSIIGNKVIFENQDICLISKTIDGIFPDYTRAIPSKDNRSAITFDTTSLADFCKANKGKNATITLHDLKLANGSMSATAKNNDSESRIDLSYEGASGWHEISFNINYMLDLLSNLPGQATFYMNDTGYDPMLVESVNSTFVLMSKRV